MALYTNMHMWHAYMYTRYSDVLTYKHAHMYISMYTWYSDVLTYTHAQIYISMYTRYSDVLTYTHVHIYVSMYTRYSDVLTCTHAHIYVYGTRMFWHTHTHMQTGLHTELPEGVTSVPCALNMNRRFSMEELIEFISTSRTLLDAVRQASQYGTSCV